MNNLNSVLLEGNLTEDAQSLDGSGSKTTFTIASSRYSKTNGIIEKEINFFEVECRGKIAKSCLKFGCKGREARVVGYLKQIRQAGVKSSKVIIVAEHIEFKPSPGIKSQEEK
jgi:single-stranded DNA-binding protein